MTTATPVRPSVISTTVRPPAGPPPAAPAAAAAVDPVRILRKHWLTLVLATLVGGAIGTGAHFLLRRYYPTYRAQAVFACQGATYEVGGPTTDDEDELQRFMATQVAMMASDEVLRKAVQDISQRREAEKWATKYRSTGTFDIFQAAEDLGASLRPRVQAGTSLMSLGMGWRDPVEVHAIVRAVRLQYQQVAAKMARDNTGSQRAALNASISELKKNIDDVTAARDEILKKGEFDSLEDRTSEVRYAIGEVHQKLIQGRADLTAISVNLEDRERDAKSETGTILYPDSLRQEVESDRTVMDLTRLINGQKSELTRMRELGLGEAHRDVRRVRASITGLERQLEQERERILLERFNALLDSLRTTKAQLSEQVKQQEAQLKEHQTRLQQLVQGQTRVNDYQAQLDIYTKELLNYEASLKRLETVAKIGGDAGRVTERIILVEAERVPEEVAFPKIYIMIPAGVLLALGLTGGLVFLREMLDQRVKGPSDIALIPRTRVLGMLPHAAEDPSRPEAVESAFVDRPRGVLAESFRQLRAVVLQRMRAHGHRSLLVVSAMPGSGGSSAVANLGAALAGADERVLIIDANFRRPSQHKFFKLTDAPGLGDVLAGTIPLDEAVRETSTPSLSVLTCGSAPTRLFERFATERMTAIISEASSKYDIVLVDAAPVVVSGDARALADRCDASALVVRAYAEKRGMIARLKSELAEQRAEFLGIVINAARSSAGGYLKRNIRATHRYQNAET